MADRAYNYAGIFYPESAPANWKDLLLDSYVPCYVSPLHDKDTDENGEVKKAHYHIVYTFSTLKGAQQVRDFHESCTGSTMLQTVMDMAGIINYLTHANRPEKFQYNSSDIECLNGADIESVLNKKTIRENSFGFIADLRYIVTEKNITSETALLDSLINQNALDLVDYVSRNSYFVSKFILGSK